jgi:FkbM family methyltransferase
MIHALRNLLHREPNGIPKRVLGVLLGPSATVLEAGAHNGSDTVELAALFPAGHVHAFEPIETLRMELQRRTANLANVSTYPFALWRQTGMRPMHVSAGTSDGSSSLLRPKEHLEVHPSVLFETAVEVPTTTVDEWRQMYSVSRIDLLWLDLQGAELDVLAAAPETLRTVRAIYTEVNFREMYEGAALYPHMVSWLGARGFRVYAEDRRWSDAGNALFVRV